MPTGFSCAHCTTADHGGPASCPPTWLAQKLGVSLPIHMAPLCSQSPQPAHFGPNTGQETSAALPDGPVAGMATCLPTSGFFVLLAQAFLRTLRKAAFAKTKEHLVSSPLLSEPSFKALCH